MQGKLALEHPDAIASHEKEYASSFRRLYYYLYTNSNASRAERIICDLSNLLLVKIASERNGAKDTLNSFMAGKGSANELLLPLLIRSFPNISEQEDRFSLEDESLRYGLNELAALSFISAPAHILGEAFQSLIGSRLRGDKGQFFTPRNVVRAIIQINAPHINSKVVDPACGTGGFLVETAAYQKALAENIGSNVSTLVGLDKDRDLCRLAEASLELTAQNRFRISNTNSLDIQRLSEIEAAFSPLNADFVFTNPPFGANIKVVEENILLQYALGHKWVETKSGWAKQPKLLRAQDPQILFLELCIRLLKPGGKLGIILPEGVFGNSGLGYVWDYIRSEGEISALIDCPRTTFQPSTDTKTNILLFTKKDSPLANAPHNKVAIAVALTCGHDRRGRSTKSNGEPYPDDFETIAKAYEQPLDNNDSWQSVNITDPYYLVPRYYEKTPINQLSPEIFGQNVEFMSLRELIQDRQLTIKKGHEVGAEAYGTGDIPFIRTSDISNYEVAVNQERGVSEEIYNKYEGTQKLTPDSILLVADGRYRIGRTAILHEHNYKSVVQSHVRIITVTTKSRLKPIELLYLLNTPFVQHQMRNLVFIQSTLGVLGSRLYEVRIPVPERSAEWDKTVERFAELIDGRATLLKKLREFEPTAFEL